MFVFDLDTDLDPVRELRARLEALAGEDRSGWAGSALSELVVELAGVVERAEAELVRVVGQWDAVQAWALDGAVTAPGWLAARVALTRPDAVGLCRTARLARRHERTGKALAAGDISVSHVQTMSRAERGRRESFANDEDMLLDLAPELSPTDFVTAMQHWCHVVDDERRKRDPNAKFDQRFLDFNKTFDGNANVDGFLDLEGLAILEAALAKIAGPPDPKNGPVPPRTARQRRADALVDMARESLARATPGGHLPAHVDAVFDLNAVLGATPGPDIFGPRHTINGRAAARATLERLCCDATIGRVIMAGDSEVLDLGRRSRFPSPAQFRALIRRDQHCQFPDCDRPPEWTDAHHLQHWLHGGTTDLDNLVLLCRRHHIMCHEGRWTLHREPDGTITALPPPAPSERQPPQHAPPEYAYG
jgi:hypothetical protein